MASPETGSVKCRVQRCGDLYDTPGEMAAHIVAEHSSSPRIALINARRMFGYDTEPPGPIPLSGARRGEDTNGPVTADADDGVPPHAPGVRDLRDRRASSSAQLLPGAGLNPARQSSYVKKSLHRRDPDGCLYCARFAPERCGRHGGPSRSTSFRGKLHEYRAWRDARTAEKRLWRERRAASSPHGAQGEPATGGTGLMKHGDGLS